MKAVFDVNDLTFKLFYDTNIEREQALSSFNRKIQGWRFKTKNTPGWNGDVQFISGLNKLPAGLWGQLKKLCETYKFPLKVENFSEFLRNNVEYSHVLLYCNKLMEERNNKVPEEKKMTLRPYQPQAVFLSVKYRICMNDLSTASGKTLVMFLYAAYIHNFIDREAQTLVIEPDPEYVIQTYSEVMDYATRSSCGLSIGMVSGASSLKDISPFNFVIGNFQTLQNREQDFFSKVKFVLVDEGHRAKSTVIKKIIKMCVHAKDHVGLSGTVIDDKSADHYDILASTGPTVIRVSKKDLMDQGYAPNINIKIYVLDYLPMEERKNIAFMKMANIKTEVDQYDHEMSIIRSNDLRMNWVAKLIADLPKNSLTFFIDKQNEFGKRLYNRVRQFSQKELFYIDGDVKQTLRETYKERMELGNNKGLLATYQTYATGKNIKNLHYFVMAEPMKSDIVVGQAVGRGMREFLDKEEFFWIDIVDDFSWDGNLNGEPVYFENILYRQMKDRIKIYRKDKFAYEVIHIKINPNQHKLF